MTPHILFKYIAVFIISIFLLWLSFKTFSYQTQVIEGMKSKSKSHIKGYAENYAEEIKRQSDDIIDELKLDKYRKNYEDVIINMEDLIDANILKIFLSNNISDENGNITDTKILNSINLLALSKKTLNDAMTTLDSKK